MYHEVLYTKMAEVLKDPSFREKMKNEKLQKKHIISNFIIFH